MKNTVLLLSIFLLFTSCNSALFNKVKEHHELFIGAMEVNDMIQKKDPILLIDIRSQNMYQAGHLPTAINIPFYKLDSITNKYSTFVQVIIYDQDMTRVKDLIKKIRSMGYSDSYALSGGYNSWRYEIVQN